LQLPIDCWFKKHNPAAPVVLHHCTSRLLAIGHKNAALPPYKKVQAWASVRSFGDILQIKFFCFMFLVLTN